MKLICVVRFATAVGSALAPQFPAAATAHWNEKVLYSFAVGNGADPTAGLIDVNGMLYGTAADGGAHSDGTVFALNPGTGHAKVVHSFGSGTDGQGPTANLINVNGTLYGTTENGGAHYYGTVFALDPKTGAETVVHSFGSGTDGGQSLASLIDVNGALYGTTYGGGVNGQGTVFALDPSSGAETVVYSFCANGFPDCADGEYPAASLIDVKGTLYGTTSYGGTGNCSGFGSTGCGTVFAVDSKSGAETVLYSFCSRPNCTDGENPFASLIDVNGTLYGTAYGGGANCQNSGGCGTVFALDPNTRTLKVLYSFCGQENCKDGEYPAARLIDVRGALYGTTYGGGSYNIYGGTVFALNVSTGAVKVVHSFGSGTDGQAPGANLINVNGTLYGTTTDGGTHSYGTVFVLRKP